MHRLPIREILRALHANGWHAGRTARALGIGRATLWRRLSARGVSLRQKKNHVWQKFWLLDRIEQARERGALSHLSPADQWIVKQLADFARRK